ncbi:hypothetical protein BV22DRAFT_416158 [Leucogyrophana mollusca]|uniref:Uncharacterized protein n=1 Tax=Leucogyrophana mollusca TaxID=85980 RepID=A0ACB8BKA3_9AGAM|nr:hypothetical protein BV22DRAFT_416158 [Leucogyrophana mollusca]
MLTAPIKRCRFFLFLMSALPRSSVAASNPSCDPWMLNSRGQTPCVVASLVDQACSSTSTLTLSVNQSTPESDYAPNRTTANACSCSWASYNLMSACTSCLNGALLRCPRYFPWSTGSRLPSNESIIPFWATTNPQNWAGETFDVTNASNIAQEYQSNVNGAPVVASSSPSPSSTASPKPPVGAIVGGVVGGVALLLIAGGFVFFVLRRRRREQAAVGQNGAKADRNGAQVMMVPMKQKHGAPVRPAPPGFPQTSAAMSTSPYAIRTAQSPTMNSVVSLHSLTSPTSPTSHVPLTHQAVPVDFADVITPFTATVSNPRHSVDSKSSMPETEISAPSASTPHRTRLNPPPYSPTAPTHKKHARHGSAQTQHSRTSSSATQNSASQSRRRSFRHQFRRKDGGSIDTMHSIGSVMSSERSRAHTRGIGSAGSVDSAHSGSGSGHGSDGGTRSVMRVIERRGPSV